MTRQATARPTSWTVLRLLLAAARKRGAGRARRQHQLLSHRAGKAASSWASVGAFVVALLMILTSPVAAVLVESAVEAGQRVAMAERGRLVVDQWFIRDLIAAEKRAASIGSSPGDSASDPAQALDPLDPANPQPLAPSSRSLSIRPPGWDDSLAESYAREAKELSRHYGGDPARREKALRDAAQASGVEAFVAVEGAAPGLAALPRSGPLPAMLGSMALILWSAALVFQGEGLELDMQRRRHPMWEWLFSHPAPRGAVFLAEMLTPMAANPVYFGAPLFAGLLYAFVYGPGLGAAAFFLVGAPITAAAACLGKALEIGVALRCAPRSRGPLLGLMSWLGFASVGLIFMALSQTDQLAAVLAKDLAPLAAVEWPWLGIFLGQRPDGSFSFLLGMASCWLGAAGVVAGSVGFALWGAERGLDGQFGRAATASAAAGRKPFASGGDPIFFKELTWFARDRSALVQAVLIPMSLVGFQMFNARAALPLVTASWNHFCAAAILFGTFFLATLGPRSLASEGQALWIALTWPRGLESLLKAKARLWALISSIVVVAALCCAAWIFPESAWKIGIVGFAWLIFGRSLAEKSVTLVSVAPERDEAAKIPAGRRWAVSLGTLTFAVGVATGQWSMAVAGVAFSIMTAAGMWQNFRARLPYLYDPWSERLPQPPTLMHAAIAISALLEIAAFMSGAAFFRFGRGSEAVARSLAYGVAAVIVLLVTANFLRRRGVAQSEVWLWRGEGADVSLIRSLAFGAALGLALGLVGLLYLELLRHIPLTAAILDEARRAQGAIPHFREAMLALGVLFAPVAEEYLFRGLLYRALDREWGGWRAVLGGAAFFAIYHAPIAWAPVALLGATNAALFKRTGRLAPAVVVHMVYNAIVLS